MHYGIVVMCDKPTWIIGLVQKGHGEGLDTSSCDPGGIPEVSRRIVRPYTQRQTAPRNGVTPHWLSLLPKGGGVNRMLMRKGMVSEANARGKATRYADRDPATWTVKVQVEVHML